jgi:Holliday junction resolvase RusA-like endonuclease
MTPRLEFFVPGQPVPQGSKTALISKSTGRPLVLDKDVRLPQWRQKVTSYALDAVAQNNPAGYPLVGPIGAQIIFFMPRLETHYLPANSKRDRPELRPSAPTHKDTAPDIDKLLRAILDSLTDARVWGDDGQVVFVTTQKCYEDYRGPGVLISIGRMK